MKLTTILLVFAVLGAGCANDAEPEAGPEASPGEPPADREAPKEAKTHEFDGETEVGACVFTTLQGWCQDAGGSNWVIELPESHNLSLIEGELWWNYSTMDRPDMGIMVAAREGDRDAGRMLDDYRGQASPIRFSWNVSGLDVEVWALQVFSVGYQDASQVGVSHGTPEKFHVVVRTSADLT